MARAVLSADEKKARARNRREAEKQKKAAAAQLEKEAAKAKELAARAEAAAKAQKAVAAKERRKALERERKADMKAAKDRLAAEAARKREAAAQKAVEELKKAAAEQRKTATVAKERAKRVKKRYFADDELGLEISRADYLRQERQKRAGAKTEKLLARIGKIKVNKGGGVRSTIYTSRSLARPRIGHVGNRGALKDGQTRVVYNTDVPPHTRDIYVSKRSNFALKYGA